MVFLSYPSPVSYNLAAKTETLMTSELRWISQTVKDIGVVLRDYRNYIHPHKEYSYGVTLSPADATILWDISKTITRQVLKH